MKKFSFMVVSLVAMASFAFAQQKGSGSAAPAAKAPAAGSAAPAAKAPAAGSAAPKAAGSAAAGSAAAPPKMEMPKPPPEIAASLKQMGTRMNCTGLTWGGADGKTEFKMKGSGTQALALDGHFIKGSMNLTIGEGKNKSTLKIDSYMTWDAKAGKWRSISASNDGGVMIGTSDMKDGKMDGMSDTYGGMLGDGKFRDHGEMTDPKAGMKMTGEMSKDGGKTWNKVYEMTCKK